MFFRRIYDNELVSQESYVFSCLVIKALLIQRRIVYALSPFIRAAVKRYFPGKNCLIDTSTVSAINIIHLTPIGNQSDNKINRYTNVVNNYHLNNCGSTRGATVADRLKVSSYDTGLHKCEHNLSHNDVVDLVTGR